MAATSVSSSRARTTSRTINRVTGAGAYVGLATLAAVQAWEWLFSGLAKLQNDAFVRGFTGFVSHTPGAYGRILRSVVMGGPALVPRVVEGTELTLGIALALSAAAVLLPFARARIVGIYVAGFASLVGATVAINIAITVGDKAPWRISSAPFSTGIPVEALLAGVSIAGLAQAYSAYRVNAAAKSPRPPRAV